MYIYNKTHSTPGFGLATLPLFFIFGTAERTRFALKNDWKLSRGGKTLLSILYFLRIGKLSNSQEVQDHTRVPTEFEPHGRPSWALWRKRSFFTNKRPIGRLYDYLPKHNFNLRL